MLRHVGSPALRLIIAPASVAAFAAFGLHHVGTLPALGAGWLGFVLCVLAIGAWGKSSSHGHGTGSKRAPASDRGERDERLSAICQ